MMKNNQSVRTILEAAFALAGILGIFLGVLITLINWGADRHTLETAMSQNDRLAGVIVGVGWTLAGLLSLLVSRKI